MAKYGFSVLWSDEDDCYIVTCSDFPGFSAFGETKEEALKEAEIALNLLIEAYHGTGKPLPEPSLVKTENYSGQLRLRMPKQLHENLVRVAASQGVSLNAWIVHLLSERNMYHDIAGKITYLEQNLCQRIDLLNSKTRIRGKSSHFELEQDVVYEQEGGLNGIYADTYNERSKTFRVQLPN